VNTVLDEGQLFCVDSTVPYLTVIFSFTNLLSVRYSVKDSSHTHGSFTVPGRIGGVDFSEALGTLEIESLLGGALNFTLFAFPPECRGLRYITNLDSDAFTLRQKFGDDIELRAPICIWNSEMRFTFELKAAPPAAEVLKVCRAGQCTGVEDIDRTRFSNRDYFVVVPPTDDFAATYQMRFRSSRSAAPLKVAEVLRKGAVPDLIELADRTWAEDVPPELRRIFVPQEDAPVRRFRTKPTNESTVVFMVLIIVIVFGTIVITLAVTYFYFSKGRAHQVNKAETEVLISENDPRRFPAYVYPMPMGYPMMPLQQQPMTGVFFPPAAEMDQDAKLRDAVPETTNPT
jgi:hypothetical protein